MIPLKFPNIFNFTYRNLFLFNVIANMFDKIFTLGGMVGTDNVMSTVKLGANFTNVIKDAATLLDLTTHKHFLLYL